MIIYRKILALITMFASLLMLMPATAEAKAESDVNTNDTNNSIKNGQKTAFVGGHIINPESGVVLHNATILLEGGKILKVLSSEEEVPAGFEVLNIKDKWIMPGLIDGHIHLAQSGSAFTRPDTLDATKISPYQQDQQWLLDNARSIFESYLNMGVTTIVDLGGPSEYMAHYRQLASHKPSPNLLMAGTLLSPMDMPKLSLNGKTFSKVATEEEALNILKQQIAMQADIIKIVWSQETRMTTDELYNLYKPVIDAAHKHNKQVAVHVEDLANAKRSIEAGGDILVHGVISEPIDEELIQLMKARNASYMPTLSVTAHYSEMFKGAVSFNHLEQKHGDPIILNSFAELMANIPKTDSMSQLLLKYTPYVDAPEEALKNLNEQERSIVEQLKPNFAKSAVEIQGNNLKRIIDSGVNIAFGTDAGNPGTLHAYSLLGEMREWKKAGISNQRILQAVTAGNAKAYKLSNKVGAIAPGLQADFIVLANNPLQDIENVFTAEIIVKEGQLVQATH